MGLLSRAGRAALAYARGGWPVFPVYEALAGGECSCEQSGCERAGKHPRARCGLDEATTTPARIVAWWRKWPEANVGVATGGGRVVIDVDGSHGERSLAALQAELGLLPSTLTCRSGRGRHLWFRLPSGLEVPNSAGRLGRGLDVRGDHGYVVVPPSRHAAGPRYTWLAPRHRPAVLPDWAVQLLIPAPRAGSLRHPGPAPSLPASPVRGRAERFAARALRAEAARVARAAPGARNDTLNRAGFALGQLIAVGLLDEQAVHDALEAS